MLAKTVASSRLVTSQIMTPNDANFLGKVFGGSILSLIDLAAYTTASRFAGYLCVTASFDRVDFHEPIEVGELVTLTGYVSYVGRTSLEVTIEVSAEDIYTAIKRSTNFARVTMVALKEGKPTEVPRLVCETREDKIRFLEGRLRREVRNHQREEFTRVAQTFQTATEEELETLMMTEKLSL